MQNELFTPVAGIPTTPTHTPGPYKGQLMGNAGNLGLCSTQTGETIACVMSREWGDNQNAPDGLAALKNFQLLRHAPDLLERLEWLMNEAIPGGNRFLIDMLPEDKRDGYRKCADVLARARGQS